MPDIQFGKDGAQRFRCALSVSQVAHMLEVLGSLPPNKAGQRLVSVPGLFELLSVPAAMGQIASAVIGSQATPVRALLFDKTGETNWSLPWHQDRTVVVRERHETPGYGPWSIKSRLIHVAPPFDVLEGMAILRLHLDAVDEDNAPLLIVPGSHRLGRIAEADIPAHVARLGSAFCLADVGDIWAYATPILHASAIAARPRRRRVLQVDYSARALDGGLEWLGVA